MRRKIQIFFFYFENSENVFTLVLKNISQQRYFSKYSGGIKAKLKNC